MAAKKKVKPLTEKGIIKERLIEYMRCDDVEDVKLAKESCPDCNGPMIAYRKINVAAPDRFVEIITCLRLANKHCRFCKTRPHFVEQDPITERGYWADEWEVTRYPR